jgi:hypothetical protein
VDGIELGHIDLEIEVLEIPILSETSSKKSEFETIEKFDRPDLILQITESINNGQSSLLFRITSSEASGLSYYLKPYGPVTLKLNPSKYFQDFFQDIEDLPMDDEDQKRAIFLKLGKKGMQLFENVFPEDLRNLIWSIKDRIKTLKIDSEEPWIPWEICKLTGVENGRNEEGKFFCEAFEVTRWIPGHGAPRSKINFSKMAMVIPKDSGLDSVIKEKDEISRLMKKDFNVDMIPANYVDITSSFEKGKYTIWHFSGHGSNMDSSNPNNSYLLLEKGAKLTPEVINGKAKNLGIPRPLVFLNACQVGKSAMGLTGIGGWVSQFLDAGATSFIGAYWSVADGLAYEFAVNLYKSLLKGNNIGKAVHEARISIKKEGDPTWLAYTVYADPFATRENA